MATQKVLGWHAANTHNLLVMVQHPVSSYKQGDQQPYFVLANRARI